MKLAETRSFTLTRKEVFALRSLLLKGIGCFTGVNRCAEIVIRTLFEQTLSYSKYAVIIPHDKFISEYPRPGEYNNMKPGQMRRHRLWLIDQGLLIYESRPTVGLYLPNIVGMSRELVKFYEAYSWLDSAVIKNGIEIFEKVLIDFEASFYPIIPAAMEGSFMKTIEDTLEQANEQNEKGKVKRLKREQGGGLSPANMARFMRNLCEEHEEKFFDPVANDCQGNKKERGKFFGSCRNFLSYWKKRDEDPKEFLDKVVRYWPEFREGKLKGSHGYPITLPSAVSFTEFFKHRAIIEEWIKFADKREQDMSNVVVHIGQHKTVAESEKEVAELLNTVPEDEGRR